MTEVQFAKQFLTTLDSKPTKYQPDHVFDPKTFQIRVPYTLPKLSHPPHPLPLQAQQSSSIPAPGSQPAAVTVDITLKSTRNPTFTLHLPSLPSKTPITTLKIQVQALLSQAQPTPQIAAEKIKILYNKKPIPATKFTIEDVISDTAAPKSQIEFGVMVMGGASDPTPTTQTLNLNNELKPSPKNVGPESEKAAAQASESHAHPHHRRDQDDSTSGVPGGTTTTEAVQPGEISGRDVLKTKGFWDDLQGFLEQRLRNSEVASEVRAVFEKAIKNKGHIDN